MSCSGSALNDAHGVDDRAADRQRMVDQQLRERDINDVRVLASMSRVPRHLFVPAAARDDAYDDRPLPIGGGQTISQPYIVALMTQLLSLRGDETVLEVGTGSGYQAAVLSGLARTVYSIEIDPSLAASAAERLKGLGFTNVHVRSGDGFLGWPEAAPFDAIIVTAAAPRLPEPLAAQLRDGGRLVIPTGGDMAQQLMFGIKRHNQLDLQPVADVLFVPMRGLIHQPPPGITPSSTPTRE